MIFCQKWVQRLREFRKIVVNSVLGMSQEIGVKWGGWYIVTYLLVNNTKYLIIMTYETMNTMKCEGIRLGEVWFLLVVIFLKALSDAVAHHVVVWVLQLD